MAVTQQQVAEVYVATFNRAPDAAGLAYWVNDSFGGNPTIEQIAASFFDQSETQALYPEGTTDEAFVTSIYQNLFNRAPDADGLAYWTGTDGLGGAMTRDVMIEAMKNGATGDDAEIIANKAEVGLYYAEQGLDGTFSLASVTADDATVTTAKADVDGLIESLTLTTSADAPTMTSGNDTVDGSGAGTLNSGDVILDQSTTDSDVLNATIATQNLAPTIKNIEAVNLTWTSNADFDFDATNSTGNTFNLTATGLAFTGNSAITKIGSNDVSADSTIIGTLGLTGVTDTTVDAGSAAKVTLAEGTVSTVGASTMANITMNGNMELTNAGGTAVDKVTVQSTVADTTLTLTAGATQIDTSLTITGDKSMVVSNDTLTGEKIVNELTAGTLTVKAGDAGALDVSKIDADVIELTAGATAVTVADNQNLLVKSAANAALASFVEGTGVTGATVNLESQMGTTAITALDISGITKLNLDVEEDTTISDLTIDINNSVVVTGDSNLTLSDISETNAGSDAVSIDASALTGNFTITTADKAILGIVGSTTGKNNITMKNTTENATIITGSANDTIDASTVTAATAKFTLGGGDDTVTIADLTTNGKLTIDAGAGDDTLVIDGAGNDISGAKTFSLTGVENMAIDGGSTLAGWMLTGQTYNVKSDASNATLNVTVTNPDSLSTVTTDLSGLVFSTSTATNFSSVVVTGSATKADVITGSSMDDTITAGGGAAKDTIDLGTGDTNNDIVSIGTADDSTYTADNDFMDSITNFAATSAATGGDKLTFATAGTLGSTDQTDTDVKGAITGGTGAESVVANISATGILSISGVDSSAIDTLTEWMAVAKATLEADQSAAGSSGVVAGDTVAFQFDGNTYVYTVDDDTAANAITSADIVELVDLTGVTALSTAANAANTIFIG